MPFSKKSDIRIAHSTQTALFYRFTIHRPGTPKTSKEIATADFAGIPSNFSKIVHRKVFSRRGQTPSLCKDTASD